jgi:hypothetical protein
MLFKKPQQVPVDIEFEDDMNFYHASRVAKLVIVGFMHLLVVLCLAGFFGYGFWTKKTTGDNTGVFITYERFLRVSKETPLTIDLVNGHDAGGIAISRSYLKKVHISQVVPEPASVANEGPDIVFRFSNGSVAGDASRIYIYTVARKPGPIAFEVTAGGKNHRISQFIYP